MAKIRIKYLTDEGLQFLKTSFDTNIEIYKPTDYEPYYRLWLRCGKVIYDDFYTSDSLSEINRIRDRLLKLCNAEVITLDELAGEEDLEFERQ